MERRTEQRSLAPRGGRLAALLVAAVALAGCRGDRVLTLTSTPPGATVRLDDESVGVTPLDVPIDHYGTRLLTLYEPDSRLYSEPVELVAPWWTRFPVDILTELLLPIQLDDRQRVHVSLLPASGEEAEPITASFVEEAIRVRAEARAKADELDRARPLEAGAPPAPDPEPGPAPAPESEVGPGSDEGPR